MSTSIERVLNNPYLLADIMRYVAQTDKVRDVLSTLCVSRAFRNPHVVRTVLGSIGFIHVDLRNRVTYSSMMSCIDIDHVNNTVERSEVCIDSFLVSGDYIPFGHFDMIESLDILATIHPSVDLIVQNDFLHELRAIRDGLANSLGIVPSVYLGPSDDRHAVGIQYLDAWNRLRKDFTLVSREEYKRLVRAYVNDRKSHNVTYRCHYYMRKHTSTLC